MLKTFRGLWRHRRLTAQNWSRQVKSWKPGTRLAKSTTQKTWRWSACRRRLDDTLFSFFTNPPSSFSFAYQPANISALGLSFVLVVFVSCILSVYFVCGSRIFLDRLRWKNPCTTVTSRCGRRVKIDNMTVYFCCSWLLTSTVEYSSILSTAGGNTFAPKIRGT